MTTDKLLQKISELYKRVEALRIRGVSDPNQAAEVLSDVLEDLLASSKEIASAEDEFIDQNGRGAEAVGGASQDREDLLRAVFKSTQDAIIILDDKMRCLRANPSAGTITGLPHEQLIGQLLPDFVDTGFDLSAAWSAFILTGRFAGEVAIKHIDGNFRTVEATGIANILPGQHLFIGHDITERKRTEEALHESVQRYREIVETTEEGIAIHEPDGTITYVNQRMADMLGYSREEIIGRSSLDFVGDEEKEAVTRARDSLKEHGGFSKERKMRRKDGRVLWTLANVTPRRDDAGSFIGYLAMHTNITERRRAEEGLKKDKNALEAIMENTSAQLAYLDPQFNFIEVNSAYATGSGHQKDGLVGRNHFDLFPDAENQEIFQRVVDTGEHVRFSAKPFRFADQPWREITYWDWSLVPIKDAAGKVEALVFSLLDVTERTRMEEALRKANEELERRVQERTAELVKANEELYKAKEAAEAAAETKAAFMANMSHELRTPMNYIVGMTSLLLEEPLSPELKDYVETIRQGSDEMMALINNILDFTKVEKDKAVLEYQPLNLRALVDESLEMVASQAAKKSLSLASTIKHGTPDSIVGDYGRLRQIITSLLSNAIKFTDEGEISLSVSSKPLQKANKHQILFAVKDTGIGIPPEKMTELFQPFAQVETAINKKRDGVGLGLATNKKLVELMGGEIWVKSEVGKGSTFYFTVEAEIALDEDIKLKPIAMTKAISKDILDVLAEQHPLRILVAEDIPSNQTVLLEMLKRMGYRADAVTNGKEVLKALEIRPYDLILMDVKMPELDGIEAAKEIRRRWPDNGPKIVAITAYALHGDKERCLEAGMDDYIAKPVQKEDLAEVLKRYALKA